MNKKLAAVLAASLLVPACLPPPSSMATEGTLRAPEGSTSGAAGLAYIGDFVASPGGGLAGGARVSHQATRNVAVGGEGSFGGYFEPPVPGFGRLYAGGARASVRVSPDSDHFAFVGGLGGGAFAGGKAGFLTFDAGVRVGWNYRRMIELFASETLSASVMIDRASDNTGATTFRSITEIGLVARPTERLGLGASLSMFGGIHSNGQWEGNRPFFIPGIFGSYTFGGR